MKLNLGKKVSARWGNLWGCRLWIGLRRNLLASLRDSLDDKLWDSLRESLWENLQGSLEERR